MEEIINGLHIQTIRAKLELCRLVCETLAREFENPNLSFSEKTVLSRQRSKLLREGDILALFLELLGRREKERMS